MDELNNKYESPPVVEHSFFIHISEDCYEIIIVYDLPLFLAERFARSKYPDYSIYHISSLT